MRPVLQRAILLGALTWPTLGLAAVTLPFSTTYDCAEQQQADGTWVTCDGLSSSGGWTTSNGAKEAITTSANYSSGGGGRGQRHWIGDGTNNNSGSIHVGINSPPQVMYVRFYFRYQSGISMSGGSHKILYFTGSDCSGNAGGCYFAFEGTGNFRLTVAGSNYDNGSTWGWNDLHGGASSDGNWHWVEVMVNRTAGTAKAWFDGTLRLDQSSVTYGGSGAGFSGFELPENAVVSTGGTDKFEDIDDLAIQTTGPIGALSGGGSGGGGGSVMFFLRGWEAVIVGAQVLMAVGYLWERRLAIGQAVATMRRFVRTCPSPIEMVWMYRYRVAVKRWQRHAPVMLPPPLQTLNVPAQNVQHQERER